MNRICATMVLCLTFVSLQAFSQNCSINDMSSYCKVDARVDDILNELDLRDFTNQDQLLLKADQVCDGLENNGRINNEAKNSEVDTVAEEICINKMSKVWMEHTLAINNDKIAVLSEQVELNNLSLEQMKQVIQNKKDEIESLK